MPGRMLTSHCGSVGYILRLKYTRLKQIFGLLRTVDYGGGAKSIMLPKLDFRFLANEPLKMVA